MSWKNTFLIWWPKTKKGVVWWCDTLMYVILTWGVHFSQILFVWCDFFGPVGLVYWAWKNVFCDWNKSRKRCYVNTTSEIKTSGIEISLWVVWSHLITHTKKRNRWVIQFVVTPPPCRLTCSFSSTLFAIGSRDNLRDINYCCSCTEYD